MEDNIQVIVGIIISVFLFFVFPVYMAYEKKDDIAYALALRYTQDLVDDVRSRGYITEEMLNSYKEKLDVTGNTYDIQLTHIKRRFDPITKFYKKDAVDENKYILLKTLTRELKEANEMKKLIGMFGDGGSYESVMNMSEKDRAWVIDNMYRNLGVDKVEDTYFVSEEVYNTNHIEAVLATENKMWPEATTDNFVCVDDGEHEAYNTTTKRVKGCKKVYIMNKEDEFNVTIKNTNTTLATSLYNMVTVSTIDNNTRIYINYGGKILNEKWYGKIDYSKMKHDNINMQSLREKVISLEVNKFENNGSSYPEITLDSIKNMNEYILEFEVKPFEVVDLRQKGYEIIATPDASLYNFAAGAHPVQSGLQVSIGINGISILYCDATSNITFVNTYIGTVRSSQVLLSYPTTIAYFTKVKIKVEKQVDRGTYKVILYINDERVAESIEIDKAPHIYRIGQGYLPKKGTFLSTLKSSYFSGYIRNIKVYY